MVTLLTFTYVELITIWGNWYQ